MSAPIPKIEPGWHYEAAEQSALELEALLTEQGIRIQSGSPFEREVLSVLHLVAQKRAGRLDPTADDIREPYRSLIGVHELASLVLAARHDPQFPALIPHLRLLNQGAILQNSPSPGTDSAANKLFELYMGAVALQCGSDLAMDDPFLSRGDNPDILSTLCGRRWGIACKVLHGRTPQGFVDNLLKGLDQIDRSAAEIGVVCFNFKNIILHDEIWPLAPIDGIPGHPLAPAAWDDPNAPFQLLIAQLQSVGVDLDRYLPAGHVLELFRGRKSVPGFLVWGASPSAAVVNGRPTPCSVRVLNFQNAGPVDEATLRVFACLNWALYPDSAARETRPGC